MKSVSYGNSPTLTIDITGFTKDINKLVNSVHVDITNDYSYFLNGEFDACSTVSMVGCRDLNLPSASGAQVEVRFLECSVIPILSRKGKGSSETSVTSPYYNSQPDVTESHPLAWDQRHIFSGLLDIQLPFDSAFNLIGRYGSGLPYTPNPRATTKPDINSKRYPPL